MFSKLLLCIDYATWCKWQLLGIVSGAALGWCLCDLWQGAYDDARKGGAVA